jgi:hypothetical protein
MTKTIHSHQHSIAAMAISAFNTVWITQLDAEIMVQVDSLTTNWLTRKLVDCVNLSPGLREVNSSTPTHRLLIG